MHGYSGLKPEKDRFEIPVALTELACVCVCLCVPCRVI